MPTPTIKYTTTVYAWYNLFLILNTKIWTHNPNILTKNKLSSLSSLHSSAVLKVKSNNSIVYEIIVKMCIVKEVYCIKWPRLSIHIQTFQIQRVLSMVGRNNRIFGYALCVTSGTSVLGIKLLYSVWYMTWVKKNY